MTSVVVAVDVLLLSAQILFFGALMRSARRIERSMDEMTEMIEARSEYDGIPTREAVELPPLPDEPVELRSYVSHRRYRLGGDS